MRYTGHERDLGSNAGVGDDLDYMHARYYKPIWGRFLSVDPVVGSPDEPQSWNRYSYVTGNPLRFVDPTGAEKEFLEEFRRAGAWAHARDRPLTRYESNLQNAIMGPFLLIFAPVTTLGLPAEAAGAAISLQATAALGAALQNPDRPIEAAVVAAYTSGGLSQIPGVPAAATPFVQGFGGVIVSDAVLNGGVQEGTIANKSYQMVYVEVAKLLLGNLPYGAGAVAAQALDLAIDAGQGSARNGGLSRSTDDDDRECIGTGFLCRP